MKKSFRQHREHCYITIENDKMIGRQLFNLAYLINILKTKNSEHFKRKIVFNKANKLYYDSLFKGLFNILDTEKFKSIQFETIDIDSLDNADNADNVNNADIVNNAILGDTVKNIEIYNKTSYKLDTFKNIDGNLRNKIIELVYSNEDLMYSAYYKYRDVLHYFGNSTTDDEVAVMHFMKDTDMDYYSNALSLMHDTYKVSKIAVLTDDINWANIALSDMNRDGNYSFYYITADDVKDNYEINFILMSMFKNFIVTHKKESVADSLWASYISYYDNKKVVVSESISEIHKYITDII